MVVPPRESFTIPCQPIPLELGPRTLLMGILNITPDSFSDGGEFIDPNVAVEHARQMIADGADIIDIGAESTRPGSEGIDAEEELRRVLPVINALASESSVPLSVDTSKSLVAARALEKGARMINDVTGFQGDPDMARVAADHLAPSVLMHIRGAPRSMNRNTQYLNLVGEICEYLRRSMNLAAEAGLPEKYLIVDPGIGFAKGHRQNLELVQRIPEFACLGRPVLMGPSRKSFIGQTLGLPPKERIWGTAAAAALCAWNGAHILRVHDVKEMRQVLEITDAVRCPLQARPRPM